MLCHSLCVHRRLCESSSFDMHKPDADRQQTTRTSFAEENVLQELKHNPHSTYTRLVSWDTHFSQSIVWRIIHGEWLHPFPLQCIQTLELNDRNKQMNICAVGFARIASRRNRHMKCSVYCVLTREWGYLSGWVHNLHTWADENPLATYAWFTSQI